MHKIHCFISISSTLWRVYTGNQTPQKTEMFMFLHKDMHNDMSKWFKKTDTNDNEIIWINEDLLTNSIIHSFHVWKVEDTTGMQSPKLLPSSAG